MGEVPIVGRLFKVFPVEDGDLRAWAQVPSRVVVRGKPHPIELHFVLGVLAEHRIIFLNVIKILLFDIEPNT